MFYIYEHIRPDTGMVFYVGKGSGYRSNSTKDRNKHWQNIVNKANGFLSKIIFTHQDEELVLLAEQERIDQLKRLGVKLCNVTLGGEGITGLKHSEASKQKMRDAAFRRTPCVHTNESKEKIRLANTGVIFTEERKRKIAEKAKGRKMPIHVRENLNKIMVNYKHSPEVIARMKEIQRSMPKRKCLHCSFVGNAGNLKRWHDDNCKLKGEKNE